MHPLSPSIHEMDGLSPSGLHPLPAVAQPVDFLLPYDDLFKRHKRGVRQDRPKMLEDGIDVMRHLGRVDWEGERVAVGIGPLHTVILIPTAHLLQTLRSPSHKVDQRLVLRTQTLSQLGEEGVGLQAEVVRIALADTLLRALVAGFATNLSSDVYSRDAGVPGRTPGPSGFGDGLLESINLPIALPDFVRTRRPCLSDQCLHPCRFVLQLVDRGLGSFQLGSHRSLSRFGEAGFALGFGLLFAQLLHVVRLPERLGAESAEGCGERFAVVSIALDAGQYSVTS